MKNNEFTEVQCLNCGEGISLFEGDLLTKCKKCSFFNTILPEKTFEAYLNDHESGRINDPRFDILVLKKKKLIEQGDQYHYAFPDLAKEEFKLFRAQSPGRAKSLLKYLKNEELSDAEDSIFRGMKFEYLDNQQTYLDKIDYLQIKLKILKLIK